MKRSRITEQQIALGLPASRGGNSSVRIENVTVPFSRLPIETRKSDPARRFLRSMAAPTIATDIKVGSRPRTLGLSPLRLRSRDGCTLPTDSSPICRGSGRTSLPWAVSVLTNWTMTSRAFILRLG